ncbi:MAG: DUF3108 domain-containing protein, partial [bacterium]
ELVSLRYEKHLREGKYKNDRHIVFDQKELNAYYDDQVIPIAPRTQDVLSAMYYVRTLPLEVGHSVAIANHTDGRNYPLVVKVLGEERVKVEAGTFDCLVVEPFLRYPGIFKQKGRVKVWVTNDRYHIPVLVKSKIVIGEVSAVLKEYRLADKFQRGRENSKKKISVISARFRSRTARQKCESMISSTRRHPGRRRSWGRLGAPVTNGGRSSG